MDVPSPCFLDTWWEGEGSASGEQEGLDKAEDEER